MVELDCIFNYSILITFYNYTKRSEKSVCFALFEWTEWTLECAMVFVDLDTVLFDFDL